MAIINQEEYTKVIDICSDCGNETTILSRERYDEDAKRWYILLSCKKCGAEIEGIKHVDGKFTDYSNQFELQKKKEEMLQ